MSNFRNSVPLLFREEAAGQLFVMFAVLSAGGLNGVS